MYIRPTFLPEATFLLGPTELNPPATSVWPDYTNVRAYDPADSNRSAVYSQHKSCCLKVSFIVSNEIHALCKCHGTDGSIVLRFPLKFRRW